MRKILKKQFACLVCFAVVISGCADSNSTFEVDEENNVDIIEIPTSETINLTEDESTYNDKLNDFAFSFLNQMTSDLFISSSKDGNVVVSPLSASLALTLIANATDEETTQSIANALGMEDLSSVNSTVNKLMRYLSSEASGAELNIANSVWHHNIFEPSDSWKQFMASTLYSSVTALDFDNPSSIGVINQWCSDNTKGMIKDFLSNLDSSIPVVMLNAMYFAGAWTYTFDKNYTDYSTFYGTVNDSEIQMMHAELKLNYYKNAYLEAVIIPFKGCTKLVMLLPSSNNTVEGISGKLNKSTWKEIQSSSNIVNVTLSMPKFKIETEFNISGVLSSLGVPCNGLLTKMGVEKQFPLGVMQKTSSQFDEDGASVAAVTGGIFGSTGNESTQFENVELTFNRPFVFIVQNDNTDTILMAGVINNL